MNVEEYKQIKERMNKFEATGRTIEKIKKLKNAIQPNQQLYYISEIVGPIAKADVPPEIRKELTDVVLAFLDGKKENFKDILKEI